MALADFSETEEEYTGDKAACDNCGRLFEQEETIMVEKIEGLIFCFSDPLGSNPFNGCSMAYSRANRQLFIGRPKRFRGKPGAESPTNNAEDIVDQTEEEKVRHSERAKRLLEGF